MIPPSRARSARALPGRTTGRRLPRWYGAVRRAGRITAISLAVLVVLYLGHLALGLHVLSVGGLEGSTVRSHRDGDIFEYSERLTFAFDDLVLPGGLRYELHPNAPSAARLRTHGLELRVRMTPGIIYTLVITPSTHGIDGASFHAPFVFHFTTPTDVVIPKPERVVRGQPYRYGVLAHPSMDITDAAHAKTYLDLLSNLGLGFVRYDFPGADIERSAHQYDFAKYDAAIEILAKRHITMLPVILQYGAAQWATGGRPYPAMWSSPDEYARFAAVVAAHLHTRFPSITRVELFNEPNMRSRPNWWDPGDGPYAGHDGAGTAAYMQRAYAAIKAVNPHLTIVGPALATGGDHTDARDFLRGMYAAGCRTGVCWDVLSVHDYDWENPTFTVSGRDAKFDIYRDLQQIASDNGDGTPHVMLTEWGYSTSPTEVGFDPRVQARYIALGLNRMLDDPTVDGVAYVQLTSGSNEFWDATGLTDPQLHPLPAYAAFRAFTTP